MTIQNNVIGVGIVGASPERGWALNAHIPALRLAPRLRLAAVSTSRPESAAAAAQKFGVPAFHSVDDLTSFSEVDLVVVSVRVQRHFDIVRKVIAAGKHVYCEWPLGVSTVEAVELANLARASGVSGFVGLQGRFNPTVLEMGALLDAGYVGDILSTSVVASGGAWGDAVDAATVYTTDPSNGATMLTIPISHTLNTMSALLGAFRPSYAAFDIRRKQIKIIGTEQLVANKAPDQIAIAGHFENDVFASLHYRGGGTRGTNFLWEINGSSGDLQIRSHSGNLQLADSELFGAQGKETLHALPVSPTRRWVPPTAAGAILSLGQAYQKVADALIDGTPGAQTFDDAVVQHRVVDQIIKLENEGRV